MLDYENQNWKTEHNYLQSPINIKDKETIKIKKNLFFETDKKIKISNIINMGNNLKFEGSGVVRIYDKNFQFSQFHFHRPSEHLINDDVFDFELHFVFVNNIGQLLVVAYLLNLGKENKFIKDIINKNKNIEIEFTKHLRGYRYLGSLTTPPISPGVEWIIINDDSQEISKKQLNWFKNNFPSNNRQLQALKDRKIEKLY